MSNSPIIASMAFDQTTRILSFFDKSGATISSIVVPEHESPEPTSHSCFFNSNEGFVENSGYDTPVTLVLSDGTTFSGQGAVTKGSSAFHPIEGDMSLLGKASLGSYARFITKDAVTKLSFACAQRTASDQTVTLAVYDADGLLLDTMTLVKGNVTPREFSVSLSKPTRGFSIVPLGNNTAQYMYIDAVEWTEDASKNPPAPTESATLETWGDAYIAGLDTATAGDELTADGVTVLPWLTSGKFSAADSRLEIGGKVIAGGICLFFKKTTSGCDPMTVENGHGESVYSACGKNTFLEIPISCDGSEPIVIKPYSSSVRGLVLTGVAWRYKAR